MKKIILLSCLSVQYASAVLPFEAATDASGNFTTGSWSEINSGDNIGSLVSSSAAAVAGPGTADFQVVDNFASGQFRSDTISGLPRTNGQMLGFTIQFQIIGGTADLWFEDNANGSGNGVDQQNNFFDSFRLTGFEGQVTGFNVTVTFDDYVNFRDDGDVTSATNRPWLLSTAFINGGTGLTRTDFEATATVSDILSDPDGNGVFTPGIIGTGAGLVTSINGAVTGGGSTSATGNMRPGATVVRSYDADGNGVVENSDAALIKARTMSWDLSLDDPADRFQADTLFNFTLDGALVAPVPEPSTGLLSLLGIMGFLGRRRRK